LVVDSVVKFIELPEQPPRDGIVPFLLHLANELETA